MLTYCVGCKKKTDDKGDAVLKPAKSDKIKVRLSSCSECGKRKAVIVKA